MWSRRRPVHLRTTTITKDHDDANDESQRHVCAPARRSDASAGARDSCQGCGARGPSNATFFVRGRSRTFPNRPKPWGIILFLLILFSARSTVVAHFPFAGCPSSTNRMELRLVPQLPDVRAHTRSLVVVLFPRKKKARSLLTPWFANNHRLSWTNPTRRKPRRMHCSRPAITRRLSASTTKR